MGRPLVSVILLTCGQEETIGRAIESVQIQDSKYPFEILVGVDFALDNTLEIIQGYEQHDSRIRVIAQNRNVGFLENERLCFEASKGNFISFLEGDDYWVDTKKVESQCEILLENPNIGLVHSDVNIYNVSTKEIQNALNLSANSQLEVDYSFETILCSNKHSIKTMTTCFRKSIIDQHYSYEYAISQNWKLTDLPLWLTLAYHSEIYYQQKVTAVYNLYPESASRSKDPKKLHEFHKSVFDIKYFYWDKYSKNQLLKVGLDKDYYTMSMVDSSNMGNLRLFFSSLMGFLKSDIKKKDVLIVIKSILKLGQSVFRKHR